MLLNAVGLQLYSLREETKADFAGTVRKVAQMGYKGVEFAGYGGLTPNEMAKLLKECGLEAWGSHIGALPKDDKALEAEIEMNLAVGSRYLVCPYAAMKTRDDALRLADVMNETAMKLRKVGLRLGYHNHAHEFVQDGGEYLLDTLLTHVEEDIFLEADVFWVAYAGEDPMKYIAKYPRRQPLIHLKELGADGKSNVEAGTGVLDFAGIVRKAYDMGVEHFIVEQEEYTMPPLESCKASLDALLRLE